MESRYGRVVGQQWTWWGRTKAPKLWMTLSLLKNSTILKLLSCLSLQLKGCFPLQEIRIGVRWHGCLQEPSATHSAAASKTHWNSCPCMYECIMCTRTNRSFQGTLSLCAPHVTFSWWGRAEVWSEPGLAFVLFSKLISYRLQRYVHIYFMLLYLLLPFLIIQMYI